MLASVKEIGMITLGNESCATIRITVDGAPIGKGRPRFVRMSGRVFTPQRTASYEAILAAHAGIAMNGEPPLQGPLAVRVIAYMPVAASWPKKKLAAALNGTLRPGKPDADNILKALDALNHIVWHDDAQIAEASISKLYDSNPRLEIEVTPLQSALNAPTVRAGLSGYPTTAKPQIARPGAPEAD